MIMTDQDAKYQMAFSLVLWLDHRLSSGRALRDCYGTPMFDLFEVVQAILDDRYPPVYYDLRLSCEHCDRDFIKKIPAPDLERYLDFPFGECPDCFAAQAVAFEEEWISLTMEDQR